MSYRGLGLGCSFEEKGQFLAFEITPTNDTAHLPLFCEG